jgi:hypothetical protein
MANKKMKFQDISMESIRIYWLPAKSGTVLKRIDNPVKLHVAKSGSHRVEDTAGKLHYISPGFLAIDITLKSGRSGWSF